MIPYLSWRTSIAAMALGVLAMTGCAETAPTRFYTLSTADTGAPTAAAQPVSVGVGPVTLPQYLDRPQLVRRGSLYTFDLADFDHWGEPLDDMFPRILAENLSASLGSDRVFAESRPRTPAVDYQVEVEVLRFDADVSGEAYLIALWEVLDKNGKSLRLAKSTITEAVVIDGSGPAAGVDYEAVVAALSRTVATLGEEIASVINSLPRQS